MSLDAALAWVDSNADGSLERLMEWLRMPSIGTDPAYREHTRGAATWAVDRLREVGLDARLRETGEPAGSGHPIVWATTPDANAGSGPHILFYGHYDVQPPDPVDLWESGPFDPVIVGEDGGTGPGRRIVARGASDDKGQVMMFLEALRAWKESAGPVAGGARFSVLLEGEEESGSANLEAFIRQNAEELKACDVCLVSDTGMLARGKPAITYGIRGLAYTEVTLHGPNQDLHSGLWGGRSPNPATLLTQILAQLWDADRRITIPGFYDSVLPMESEERDAWRALPFSQAEALDRIGLPPEADIGEAGYSALEREWARPAADINGIIAGYTGEGAKTVIPASATAKVSFRLVANQNPDDVVHRFFAWLDERTPPGCRWDRKDLGGGFPATVSTESRYLDAARKAVESATGVAPALIRTGGSIPVAGMLQAAAGLDTVFMGFGLDDDRVHSPNEKFEVQCFLMGARSHVHLMDLLRS